MSAEITLPFPNVRLINRVNDLTHTVCFIDQSNPERTKMNLSKIANT